MYYWFFTWRTYASWLPGQEGFVGHYRDGAGRRVIDHTYGRPATSAIPALEHFARQALRAAPVILTTAHARAVADQMHAHARFRGRPLDAMAVLTTHVHLVFGTVDEPDPDRMLADWKAYASRALNRLPKEPGAPATGCESPATGCQARAAGSDCPPWWAEKGSARRLFDRPARARAIRYVRDQENPLIVWLSPEAAELAKEATDPWV
jgi:hypothetical protein